MLRRFLIAALTGLIFSTGAALADNGWANRPDWAAEREAAGTPREASRARRPSATRELREDIRPFSPGSHNLALDLGQVFLMGGTGSNYADSIGTQVHYTYGVSEMFAFDSSLGYSNHSEGRYSQMALTAGMRTNLAWYDKVVPYLNFGMGFYKPSYDFNDPVTGRIDSASPLLFGLHMGPGIDLEITRSLFFGAALTFHDMFGTRKLISTNLGEQDLGGTYTSFFLRAGVTF